MKPIRLLILLLILVAAIAAAMPPAVARLASAPQPAAQPTGRPMPTAPPATRVATAPPSTTPATPQPTPHSPTALLPFQCGAWFFSGANVPWQNGGYGADFATVEEWGQHTYSPVDTAATYADLTAAGAHTARWWLFTDGRGAPEFDALAGGQVTSLDADFLPSLASAISLAAQHDVYLVLTLWDFSMLFADSDVNGRGEHAGYHGNLITHAADRQGFIDNALLPMLMYPVDGYTIGTHPNVLAWEIINEPEWVITELGAVDGRVVQPVSLAQMQRFVAELAAVIHQHSSQLVTVGSASLKWNSDTVPGAYGNIWDDADLAPFAAAGTLDFYQVHYYGWMNGDEVNWSYSPVFNTFAAAGLDKPTVVGEFPANGLDVGIALPALLEAIYANGYAGAWTWSYEGVDGHGSWADSVAALAAFNQAHAAETAVANLCGQLSFLPLISHR
ncbi:MAG: hypothetical protein KC425_05270 [Anaerolineales bacterium]|nr:hypothetical protein [Anaerolineales bacterium]